MAETREHRVRQRKFRSTLSIDASSAESPVRNTSTSQEYPPPQPSTLRTEIPLSSPLADFVPTSQPEEFQHQDSVVEDSAQPDLAPNHPKASEEGQNPFDLVPIFDEAALTRSAAKQSAQVRPEPQIALNLERPPSTPAMPPKKRPGKAAASTSKSQLSGRATGMSNFKQDIQAEPSTTKPASESRPLSSKEKIELNRAARVEPTPKSQPGNKPNKTTNDASLEQPAIQQKPNLSEGVTVPANPVESSKPQQEQKNIRARTNTQKATPSTQKKPGQLATIGTSIRKKLPSSVGLAGQFKPAKQDHDSIDGEESKSEVYEVPISPKNASTKIKGSKSHLAPKSKGKSVGRKKPTAADDEDYHAPSKSNNVPTSASRSLRPRVTLADSTKRVKMHDALDKTAMDAKKSVPAKEKTATAKEKLLSTRESIEEFEESVTCVNQEETTTFVKTSTKYAGNASAPSDQQHKSHVADLTKAKKAPRQAPSNRGTSRKMPVGSQEQPIELSDHEESEDDQFSSEVEEATTKIQHEISNKNPTLRTPVQFHSSPPVKQYDTAMEVNISDLVEEHDNRKPNIIQFSRDGPKNQGGLSSKNPATSSRPSKVLETTRKPASATVMGQRNGRPERNSSGAAESALESMLSSKGKPSTKRNRQGVSTALIPSNTFKRPELPKAFAAPKAVATGSKRTGDAIVDAPSKRMKDAIEEGQKQGLASDLQDCATSIRTVPETGGPTSHDHRASESLAKRAKTALSEQALVEEADTCQSDMAEMDDAMEDVIMIPDLDERNMKAPVANMQEPSSRQSLREDLRDSKINRHKRTEPQKTRATAFTVSPKPPKLTAADKTEHAVDVKLRAGLQETPTFVETRPRAVENNKLGSIAPEDAVTETAIIRAPSLPTVDDNGSPVPNGYDVSGGGTVLQKFSQQQHGDYETEESVGTPPEPINYFPNISPAAPVMKAKTDQAVGDDVSTPLSNHTEAYLVPPRAKCKGDSQAKKACSEQGTPQETRETPLHSALESLRADPFANEDHNDLETKPTFMEKLKQDVKSTKEAQMYVGASDDEDMDEDPDKTLVNEEDTNAPESNEALSSPSSSSQISVLDEDATLIATHVDEPRQEWRDALKSHQGSLFNQLVQVAHELVSHLADKETAITDIVNYYSAGGITLIEQMEASQSAEITEYLTIAAEKSMKFAQGYKQIRSRLAKDMEVVKGSSEKYGKESSVGLEKVHKKLEQMIQQCG